MKLFSTFALFVLGGFLLFNFTKPELEENTKGVKWYTWEEAMKLQQTAPRDIMVDLYTDWCGWCKRMDETTFMDPAVSKMLNEKFYAVKFDAEQKESIVYAGKEFKFHQAGRRGIHELAYSLMDGRASYPTVVYLNRNMERVMISPGYKKSNAIIKELSFVAEKAYQKTTWQDYSKAK